MGERTGSTIIRIAVAALLAYAVTRFCAASNAYKEAEGARRSASAEVRALRTERDMRQAAWSSGPDDSEIEKLARERLGLVMPNETIFYFTEAEDKGG